MDHGAETGTRWEVSWEDADLECLGAAVDLGGAVDDAVDLIFVAKSLERVGHHAVNLADYAFFERMGLDLRHTAR